MTRQHATGFVLGASAMLLLLTCTGCATIREHPKTTAVIVGIVATSIVLSAQDDPAKVHDVRIPTTPNCKTYPESCR